ncbi:MAG: PEP-CTERM sorting domain-containing protein [Planctomycetia bacterium]|nr:PEP-CTERM sorting domain-containing protein [Planctomycetia bacterium]
MDYTLVDGETLSITNLTTTDNFVGPTEAGTSATLTLNNSSEVRFYTGNITGNITLYHTGGNIRAYNAYSGSATPFTGDVYLQGGNFYLSTGKELGTGTIYLNTNSHLVNEGSQKGDGTYTRNCVIDNNIVLSGTSANIRTIRAGWNTTTGGAATMTLNGVISGAAQLQFQAGEGSPATMYINGANTYTGGTILQSSAGNSSLVDHALYVLGDNSAFGTGTVTTAGNKVKVDVSGITALANNFTLGATETTIRNTGANNVVLGASADNRTAWDVPSGKTLIFQNTGSGSLTLGGNTATTGWMLKGSGTVKFEDSATVYLIGLENTATSITGPTDAGEKLTLRFQHQDTWGVTYTSKLSGNMDLHISVPTRFINANSDFTGNIYTSNNIYFGTGAEMGNKKSNIITMSSGHIVNQGQSNPIVPNDIVTTGSGNIVIRAGWNLTSHGGGDKSSLTLTGDISGTKGISYSGETNAGAIYLRGNNTYAGNTSITYGYTASTSANHRCWFGIGSDTAFSTGTVTVNTSIPTTVFNLETEANETRTLNNAIVVDKNTLQFANGGAGDGVINSNITGKSTNAIEFGSDKAAENVGRLFYNGVTTKNVVVNPSATLGGTGTVGNLSILDDAAFYLSSAINAEKAFTVDGTLTLNGMLEVNLDSLVSTDALLLNAESTVLGDDAFFVINNLTPTEAGTEFFVMNLGTGITEDDLLGRISVYGAGSGWGYALSDTGVLSLTMNVPEPGTWAMLLLGLGFLFFWKKRGET